MTLRTRLLIVLVGIVLVGLLVSGIVTYKSLESFLVSRLDQQLENSPRQAEVALVALHRTGESSARSVTYLRFPPGRSGNCRFQGGPTYSAWFLLPHLEAAAATRPTGNLTVSTLQNPTIFAVVSSSGLTYRALAVRASIFLLRASTVRRSWSSRFLSQRSTRRSAGCSWSSCSCRVAC